MSATHLPSKPLGRLEFIPAKNLRKLKGLQREITPARLRDFDPWLEEKEGIILVAHITNGRHKGASHCYDGGSRVEYMQGVDPDYPFRCWVLDMSEEAAARAFLAHNKDAKKPGAFARYAVGIHAGDQQSLAIKRSLDELHLSASAGRSLYGNGDGKGGEFAAFASAERIVAAAYGEVGSWDEASDRFTWVLMMGREAYPQHGESGPAHGHDADLIQAVAHIATWNPDMVGDEKRERALRQAMNTWYGSPSVTSLLEPRQVMRPPHWRLLAAQKGKTTAGSESRGMVMAREIVTNHNRPDHQRPEGVGALTKPAARK
jgi:hypothetical protein